jgi:hypothetical protein
LCAYLDETFGMDAIDVLAVSTSLAARLSESIQL